MAQWWERSPPTNETRPGACHIGGLSLLLVLALLRGFFSGFSGLPPSEKTNIPNRPEDRGTVWNPAAKVDVAPSLNIVIYSLLYPSLVTPPFFFWLLNYLLFVYRLSLSGPLSERLMSQICTDIFHLHCELSASLGFSFNLIVPLCRV